MSKTITQLPSATTPYDGTEEFAMWQGGTTVKGTLPASPVSSVKNLRDYGVTTASSAAFNKAAIDQAFSDAGPGGVVIVPNYGGGTEIDVDPFEMGEGNNLRGELPFNQYLLPGFVSSLVCSSLYDPVITIDCDGLSVKMWSIDGVHVKNGTRGLSIEGAGAGSTYNFYINAFTAQGFTEAAICFDGAAVLNANISNVYMNSSVSPPAHGIYCKGDVYQTYLQGVDFKNLWAYGCAGFAILVDCPQLDAGQPTFQGFNINGVRANGCDYASYAFRGSFVNCDWRELGTEQACQALAPNERVDFILDNTQYSSYASGSCTNVRLINPAFESTGYIPILCRAGAVRVANGGLSPSNNSLGIVLIEDRFFSAGGIGYNGTTPTDPGYTVYGSSTASTMPVFPSI